MSDAANDARITIKKNNEEELGFFTLNQETDKTINIPVPTTTSDLTNDSEFITAQDVPDAQVNADWNATSGAAEIKNKPNIPAAANDAKLVIKKNGTEIGSFTANASQNDTVNIEVPTKVSDLTNDSEFITAQDVPAAPGTLNTTNTTSLTPTDGEALSGTINLHKVSKTGSYNDLNNKPDIPTTVADMTDAGDYLKKTELCTSIETCPNVALQNGKNTFTDTNYVEKRGFSFDTPGKTTESNCQVMVNACDLLAVFDSLMNRMDSISKALAETKEELEDLKRLMPPTVLVSPNAINSTTITATATANGHGSDITSYEFCISTNKDMSENLQCYPNESNVYTFTGLTPNKYYYVIAKATNTVGTGVSVVDSARTPALAPTATVEIPEVEVSGGFQVKVSEISPKGKADNVTVQVCYQQKQGAECLDKNDPSYTVCTNPRLVTDTTIDIIEEITGLVPFEDYCVIVKVSNGDSTTIYGPLTATTSGIVTLNITRDPEGGLNKCMSSIKVTYTASITGANTSDYTFHWKVGNAEQSETSNVLSFIYSQTVTDQKVTCTATREGYGTLRDTIIVTVYSMGYYPDIDICEDDQLTVTVVRNGGNTIKSLSWGDGNTISGPSGISLPVGTTHTYNSTGTYTITANGNDDSYPCRITRVVKFAEPSHPCVLSGEGSINTDNPHLLSNEAGTETRIDSVSDHEGNWYEVVQIGTQCWLKENMRATTSPSTGTYIVYAPTSGNDNTVRQSYTSKIAHWYKNDSTTYAPKEYGLLYNWCAAVDTFRTGDNYGFEKATEDKHSDNDAWSCTFSGNRRGICPEGWHIPSNEEWTEMETVVDETINTAINNGFRGTQSGKFSTGCDWTNLNRFATSIKEFDSPGDYSYAERNNSGFSALPAGHFAEGLFKQAGPVAANASGDNLFTDAGFWSTEYIVEEHNSKCCAWTRSLRCNAQGVFYTNYDKSYGFSVRCVRDEVGSSGGNGGNSGGDGGACPVISTVTVSNNNQGSATFTAGVSGYVGEVRDLAFLLTTDSTWLGHVDTLRPTSVTFPFNLTSSQEFTKDTSGLAANIPYYVRLYVKVDPDICTTEIFTGNDAQTVSTSTHAITATNDNVCVGETVTLTAPDGYDSYLWSTDEGTQSISVLMRENRTYTVTMTQGSDIFVLGKQVTVLLDYVTIYSDFAEPNEMTLYLIENNPNATYTWTKNGTSIGTNSNSITDNVAIDTALNSSVYYTVSVSLGGCKVKDSLLLRWVANAVNKCDSATVKDHEGNIYNAIVIGDLCWTRENMRSTNYYDEEANTYIPIPEGAPGQLYPNVPYRYKSGSSTSTVYGYLYNWLAATGNCDPSLHDFDDNYYTQGVCPEGWHVPSYNDASILINVEGDHQEQPNSIYNPAMLSGGDIWSACCEGTHAPGNYNYSERNSTGFSAIPAGRWETQDDIGHYEEGGAWFWTCLPHYYGSTYWGGYTLFFYSNSEESEGFYYNPEPGMSVRCVRAVSNGSGGGGDTPSTNPSLSLSASTGNLPARRCNGTASVTYTATIENDDAEGYQYSWNESDPVSSNSFMVNYSQVGNYEVSCTATKGNLTIPATITTIVEPGCPCTGINPDTNEVAGIENGTIVAVKDVDNIFYRVVQIGEGSTAQCWMAENLRSTRYYNGESYTDITNGSIDAPSSSDPYLYNPNNYGYLYNWAAATGGGAASILSGNVYTTVRGVCPAGWHLPSYVDVLELRDNTLDFNENDNYYYGTGKLAGALPTGETWIVNGENCQNNAPCNPNFEDRNVTGFSAIRSQYYKYDNGNLSLYLYGAGFWTCYKANATTSAYLNIMNDDARCLISGQNISGAMSVRCVRDAESGSGD